jgi:MFS family permease
MQASLRLLGRRRFLPLFVTQFLGAFNDNLYKSAMVILATYAIYNDETKEATFNAVAGGLFILPFFIFSALAGQLADSMDKARIIRFVKSAEIAIMLFGAVGLILHNIPLLLAALFAMGVHSSFFGPIKYAVLPQHLKRDEVLGGTGLVEAGTYGAILLGTIAGGLLGREHGEIAAAGVLIVAVIGRVVGGMVPAAPPEPDAPPLKLDWHIIRASIRLVNATLHIPRLFLAILAISFFWAMGAILAAQFPPLVKNVFHANEQVATLFLAIFSVGVAVGSVLINRLLAGRVLAKYSPRLGHRHGPVRAAALLERGSTGPVQSGPLLDWWSFVVIGQAEWVHVRAVRGGRVRAHVRGAALTPSSPPPFRNRKPHERLRPTTRQFRLHGAFRAAPDRMVLAGVSVEETLLLVAGASVIAAWIAQKTAPSLRLAGLRGRAMAAASIAVAAPAQKVEVSDQSTARRSRVSTLMPIPVRMARASPRLTAGAGRPGVDAAAGQLKWAPVDAQQDGGARPLLPAEADVQLAANAARRPPGQEAKACQPSARGPRVGCAIAKQRAGRLSRKAPQEE